MSSSESDVNPPNIETSESKQVTTIEELYELYPGLPQGMVFTPTDSEVIFYLKKKILAEPFHNSIPTTDVFACSPDKLILDKYSQFKQDEGFFYPTRRPAADSTIIVDHGYYDISPDKEVFGDEKDEVVGYKRTLAYYHGKPPNGTRSDWVLKELRVNSASIAVAEDNHSLREKILTCVAYKVKRLKPNYMAKLTRKERDRERNSLAKEEPTLKMLRPKRRN